MTPNADSRKTTTASLVSQVHDNDGGEDEQPNFTAGTLRACGCVTVILGVFIALLVTIVSIGYVMVSEELARQAEITRAESERVAKEAERRRAEEAKRQDALAEKYAAEEAAEKVKMDEVLKRQNELREKRRREEELRILALKEDEERFRREAERNRIRAQRDKEESALFDLLAKLGSACHVLRVNTRSEFVLPNGGEAGSGLSWRVHLLPFVGHEQLHSQFKLNEPWDSEHNRKLLRQMPSVYGVSPEGKTRFRSLLNVDGKGWPYIRETDLIDGADETIAFFCADRDETIEWTKPDHLEQALDDESLAKLFKRRPSKDAASTPDDLPVIRSVVLCSYKARILADDMQIAELRALLSHDKHELISVVETNNTVLSVDNLIEVDDAAAKDGDAKQQSLRAQESILSVGKAIQEYRNAASQDSILTEQSNGQLSWRVHLLPHLGKRELYNKFKLNEAWNSPHNFALLPEMPREFAVDSSIGRTRICLPLLEPRRPFSMAELGRKDQDDPDTTCLFYFVGPSRMALWTKPDDLVIVPNQFARSLGWQAEDSILAGTLSGKCLTLPGKLHYSKVAALISRNGKESFDLEQVLQRPEQALKQVPTVQPPTPIVGLMSMPKVEPVKISATAPEYPGRDNDLRLRQVSIAILSFSDALRQSPLLTKTSSGEPSNLSWRVHVLPFMDQKLLYDKFALDEAWDSPRNLEAAAFMPEVYGTPESKDGKTDICTITGKGTLLSSKRWMSDCTDYIGNTIMLVQVADERRVPWTKPEDVELNESFKLSEIAGPKPYLGLAMGDGATMPFAAKLPAELFIALGTAKGGELVDARTIRRLSMHSLGFPLDSLAGRVGSESHRLKAATIGMLNYESSFRVFPPAMKQNNTSGQMPLQSYCLSWRVHLLRFIGYPALFNQFRLNEPWDSEHNKQLLPLMPDLYRDEDDAADSFTTRMQVATGVGTPFPEVGEAPTRRSIADGSNSTLQILIVPKSKAVPWTQPQDYEVNLAENDFSELRQGQGLPFTTFDGAVHRLPPDFDVKTFRALLTIDGKEPVDMSQF